MARPPRQGKKTSRTPSPSPGLESEDEFGVASFKKPPSRTPASAPNRVMKVEEGTVVKEEAAVVKLEANMANGDGLFLDTIEGSVLSSATQVVDTGPTASGMFYQSSVAQDQPRVSLNIAGSEDVDVEMKFSAEPPVESLLSPNMPPPPSASTSTPSGSHEPSPSPAIENVSPTKASSSSKSKKAKKPEPQLIGHLPIARDAAMATFTEIPANHYQYGTLGRSREALESMTCECTYDHGVDDTDAACGPNSDCINRLTQVECLPDDCRCGDFCQNQRFQKKEYAPIEIVQTEMKGFGLRAARNIERDDFIYEYVGDVVNSPSFKKRMRDYAEEGIRHFYFMMLQKDEFVDATKRGGIGRFANHSCNPNCFVAKWTVGDHVRMGIFANRRIKQHEELTFNYNVDRYGHDPQPCYCGEPNCVGFLGGKTQTDIATMDDLYLDALGITDENDLMELKGTKKKKGKRIDDPDFMPEIRPILDKEVPKIIAALRQTPSRKVLLKIMTRIKMTEDPSPLRQIMRLRGFSAMTNIMEDHAGDSDIILTAMETVKTWPLVAQNKAQDSKILDHVKTLTQSQNENIQSIAQKPGDDDNSEQPVSTPAKRSRLTMPKTRHRERLHLRPLTPPPPEPPKKRTPSPPRRPPSPTLDLSKTAVSGVLARIKAENQARAAAEAAEREKQAAEERAAEAAEKRRRELSGAAKKSRPKKKQETPEEKAANKEKRLLKLVGAVVINAMGKYSKQLGHDAFKEEAKKLTQTIADKEKTRPSYADSRLESLSAEKTEKIKEFAKQHMKKVMHRKKKEARAPGLSHASSSSALDTRATSSTATDTPDYKETEDAIMAEMGLDNVAMDVDDQEEEEGGDDDNGAEADGVNSHPLGDGGTDVPMGEPSDDPPDPSGLASDPRRRHPNEDTARRAIAGQNSSC
ncbi:hypothetical protein HGRIS_006750 [Hohenbuehelia grisea]|uniref:Histone-lysine N-methyltransferase, H3 lysine-36 specific n=1 Tax=Hohenbuehelia grisea TaxID=104357 RepID=A0ABR3J9X2_9AGAR